MTLRNLYLKTKQLRIWLSKLLVMEFDTGFCVRDISLRLALRHEDNCSQLATNSAFYLQEKDNERRTVAQEQVFFPSSEKRASK